ncbi:MAG: ABC transporter permease subunit [Deltaproteobacteria bacterium]
MIRVWAIFKRELAASYWTPLAYVILVVFLLWNGGVFSMLMHNFAASPEISGSRGPLQMLFGGSILYFLPILLFCPALTMRTFAEERRSGTFETLMTAPVRDIEVVVGKYLALLVVFASLWAPTMLYALVIKRYGAVDWGALAAAYTGTLLIGASFLSLGMLMSALARSQVTAFILGFAATGGLMFLLGLGKYVFTEEREQVFYTYINLWEHMEHFSVGVVDSRHVIYYVSVIALGLFLTVRAVEARKGT